MTLPLYVLAAGSLKRAFVPLCQRFSAITGIPVAVNFGPAGLLRERIEAGERCDLFASANTAHPQALFNSGQAQALQTFAFNQLNLTARRNEKTEKADWLSLLADPTLRLGTSTPGCDPSGDYTWQLFAQIEKQHPDIALKQKAAMLVGGRDTLALPEGEIASAWLIRNDYTDLFIGYAHYAQALKSADDLRMVAIPASFQPRCEYKLAQLSDRAQTLAEFVLAAEGQAFLREAGFLTVDGK